MEKKDLIKSLIRFFTIANTPYLLLDTNNDMSVPKLTLKVLAKEMQSPFNISFISPSEEFFSEIFPNLKGSIKTDTKYALGSHKVSFYKLEKSLVKRPPEDTQILIIYPCDEVKEKDVIKLIDNSKKLKKTVILGINLPVSYKGFKKYSPEFITLKPSVESAYYENMKQKLFDIK